MLLRQEVAEHGVSLATIGGAVIVAVTIVQRSVLVLAGLVLLGLVIVAPVEASLGAFAVVVPFEGVSELGQSGVTLGRVAGVLAGLVLLVHGFLARRLRRPPRAALWWGLLVLWCIATLLWATDSDASLARLETVVSLFALYLVAGSYRMSDREVRRVLMLAIVGGVAAALVVIYGYGAGLVSNFGMVNRGTLVIGGRQSNANEQAATLLLPFSLALSAMLSRGRSFSRLLAFGALALLTIAILLTMSRGGLIALAVLLFAYLLRLKIRRRLLVPILLVAVAIPFMPGEFFSRVEEAASSRGTGRFDIWIAGLHLVKRHPILGVGIGDFPVAYDDVAGYAPIFRGYHFAAHNMYLDILAETGIVGFALFCGAIWSQMRTLRRAVSRSHDFGHLGIAIEAACWGVLAMGCSGHIEWSKYTWLLWIAVAIFSGQISRHSGSGVLRKRDMAAVQSQAIEVAG